MTKYFRIFFLTFLTLPIFAQTSDRTSTVGGGLTIATFASPPPTTLNVPYLFTDASSTGACTGGGSALAVCVGTGSGFAATSGAATGLGDPGSNSIVYRNGSGTSIPATATQMSAPNSCQDAGSTDTYACNMSPVIASYSVNTFYWFKANTDNTGAASLNLNSKGALTIKKMIGGITTDLATGDIKAGQWVGVIYDGTNFQMATQLGTAVDTSSTQSLSGKTLVSPVLTGTPTAPTPSTSDASTLVATMAALHAVANALVGTGTITTSRELVAATDNLVQNMVNISGGGTITIPTGSVVGTTFIIQNNGSNDLTINLTTRSVTVTQAGGTSASNLTLSKCNGAPCNELVLVADSSGTNYDAHGNYSSFAALTGSIGCGQLSSDTGDVSNSGCAKTVVQVEGAAIPTSAGGLKTNSSKQLLAQTAADVVGLFSGCSGVLVLGADGGCHSAGGGGGGGTALNPSCTFSIAGTTCTIDVSGLTVTNANYTSIQVECFTGISTTQTPVTILTYTYTTGATYLSTITLTFGSAAAAGYCNANLTSGGVNTFNTRAGTVAPTSGDYTCAQTTNANCKNSSNVVSTGDQDLSAASSLEIPVVAGCTAGADGRTCYDPTNKQTHVRTSGVDSILGATLVTGSFAETIACTTSSAVTKSFTSTVTLPISAIVQTVDHLRVIMDFQLSTPAANTAFTGFDLLLDGSNFYTMFSAPSAAQTSLTNVPYTAMWDIWAPVVAGGASSTLNAFFTGPMQGSGVTGNRLLNGTAAPTTVNLGATHTIGLAMECTSATSGSSTTAKLLDIRILRL